MSKNNLLGKIAMSIKNIGKSRLNLTHDVSTTSGFGDMQATTCKLLIPNSNGVTKSRSLVRFGTMVAPTFGRIKSKEYHMLVPLSDLFTNFAFMLAQSKRASGLNQSVLSPDKAPNMTLGLLSRYCLIGAEVEIYRHLTVDTERATLVVRSTSVAGAENEMNTVRSNFGGNFDNIIKLNQHGSGAFTGYRGTLFNLGAITSAWAHANNIEGWDTDNQQIWIPCRNKDLDSLFGIRVEKGLNQQGQLTDIKTLGHIPLEKGSLNLTVDIGGNVYTFVFRLSSYGKRFRKAIISAGKQIDLTSLEHVEVVSLCAIYKAYFDLFGLTLYENYEVTPLYQFCRWVDLFNRSNLDRFFTTDEVFKFMLCLGKMWYTDAQDIVSAHVPSTAISPSLGLGSSFIDVSGTGANITEVDNQQGLNVNGHAFINAVEHGQLDANYLMRLYPWMNKNTVAGAAVEKRLRAQNLGDFVDSCKSNFIGYHEETMQIFDVVSTSDTFKDGEGSMLGEYGGRGLKIYDSGTNKFSTKEYCYQVSLFTIVPEAGYLQAIDPSSYAIKKTDMLLADFDGVGMEASRKSIVCGARNWSSQCDNGNFGNMDENFGFIPRGSHLKLSHNIANGDITLRDTRDAYLPYTVDKFIDIGERTVTAVGSMAGYDLVQVERELEPLEIPHASLHYRYPCRYPWMGNFTRIFAYQGEERDREFYKELLSSPVSGAMSWEYCSNSYDNFIVHMIVDLQVWSPCKAIEESFETFIEGEEKPNASMEKA